MPDTLFQERLPQVAHVGFDHGWLLLGPTFLNLGMPMLLVDRVFLDPTPYGLELFGTRDPRAPLPRTPLAIERSGRFLGLRDERTPYADPIAIGAFTNPGCLGLLATTSSLVLAVGDSWSAEQSWSTLWRFEIGVASFRPQSQWGHHKGVPRDRS
mgnify:CR=1 FL=1